MWQPIETAPKNGESVVITDGFTCVVGHWHVADGWLVSWDKSPFCEAGEMDATHWMQLPPVGSQQMTPAELRRARRSLDLTQAQLAAALGRSLSIVSKWEGGKVPVQEYVPLALQGLGWVETKEGGK